MTPTATSLIPGVLQTGHPTRVGAANHGLPILTASVIAKIPARIHAARSGHDPPTPDPSSGYPLAGLTSEALTISAMADRNRSGRRVQQFTTNARRGSASQPCMLGTCSTRSELPFKCPSDVTALSPVAAARHAGATLCAVSVEFVLTSCLTLTWVRFPPSPVLGINTRRVILVPSGIGTSSSNRSAGFGTERSCLQDIERFEGPVEHDLAVEAEPSVQHGGVDLPEVGMELQGVVVQVREARV